MNISAAVAEALLSSRAGAIIAANRAGIIRFWNLGAERLFGYTQQEALEQSPQSHYSWSDCGSGIGKVTTRSSVPVIAVTPKVIRKDGSTISLEPLKDETGQLIGMAAIMRDVTKQFQEMRALKRKDDAKLGS